MDDSKRSSHYSEDRKGQRGFAIYEKYFLPVLKFPNFVRPANMGGMITDYLLKNVFAPLRKELDDLKANASPQKAEKIDSVRPVLNEIIQEVAEEVTEPVAERVAKGVYETLEATKKRGRKKIWLVTTALIALAAYNYYNSAAEVNRRQNNSLKSLTGIVNNHSRELVNLRKENSRAQQQFAIDKEVQECIYQTDLEQQRQVTEEGLVRVQREAGRNAEKIYGLIGRLEGDLTRARIDALNSGENYRTHNSELANKIDALSHGFVNLNLDLKTTQTIVQEAVQMSKEVREDYGAQIARVFYTTGKLEGEIRDIKDSLERQPETNQELRLGIPQSELPDYLKNERLFIPRK